MNIKHIQATACNSATVEILNAGWDKKFIFSKWYITSYLFDVCILGRGAN